MCSKQLMYCSPLQRCFTLKPPVVSAALGRMCGVLAPPVRTLLQPLPLSPMCEKARGVGGAGGTRKGFMWVVGCGEECNPVKRKCWGVGSVTRLCTEKGGGGVKGVYTEGIRAHYCRLFRASTSLSRKRTRPTDYVLL